MQNGFAMYDNACKVCFDLLCVIIVFTVQYMNSNTGILCKLKSTNASNAEYTTIQ